MEQASKQNKSLKIINTTWSISKSETRMNGKLWIFSINNWFQDRGEDPQFGIRALSAACLSALDSQSQRQVSFAFGRQLCPAVQCATQIKLITQNSVLQKYKFTHILTHLQAMDKMLLHQHPSVSERRKKNNLLSEWCSEFKWKS